MNGLENTNTNDKEPANDKVVFEFLAKSVRKLKPKDRFCILLFKEFQLKTTSHNDDCKSDNPPTLSFSFVLRGIVSFWKQPIVNCLLRTNQKKPEYLAEIIRDTIQNVLKSGLTVVATVSTHDKLCIKAIEILRNESYEFFQRMGKFTEDFDESYVVDCNIIHHVYDCCRLIRSFRNQLRDKDLIFEMEGQKRIASWRSLLRIFSIDKARHPTNQKLTSLNLAHIYTNENSQLFLTEHAVQLFSESVGNEIMRSIEIGDCPRYMEDTAKFVLFMDKLFDSCNADIEYRKEGKIYRDPVKAGSPHFQIWDEAMRIMDTMRFLNNCTGLVYRPQCIDKWSCSIQSFKNIWKTLFKAKIRFFHTRKFNLDFVINMMQILRLMNSEKTQIYCESSQGVILDADILKLVLSTKYGYYEIADED